MRFTTYSAALLALLSTTSAWAEDHSAHESHTVSVAPAGIMGDHVLPQGRFMTSYSYEQMNMSGYRNGSNDLTAQQVLASGYSQAAQDMTMQMHMFGVMGGVTDDVTAMVMVPFVQKTMAHLHSDGMTSKMRSEGVGDIELSAVTSAFSSKTLIPGHQVNANLSFGVSLPTGTTDNDFMHTHHDGSTGRHHMEYDMQLGSGTVDPTLGATLSDRFGRYSLGVRGEYTPRFGENDNNYRLGDEGRVTTWAQADVTDFMSASLRLDGKRWGDVHGQDPQVSRSGMPSGRAELQAGTRVDGLVGVALYQNTNAHGGHRLELEYGVPLYQHLDGPQMKTENVMTLTYKFSF